MNEFYCREAATADALSIMLLKIRTSHADPQAQSRSAKCSFGVRGFNCSYSAILAVIYLLFVSGSVLLAQTNSQAPIPKKEVKVMTGHASGTFEVKMTPKSWDNKEMEGANFGRMSGDKQLHGGLEGTGKGEMLSFLSDVKGSGAYVAIERISGTLDGRTGSFVLQHSGTMSGASQQMNITVVPDSGTGQLTGIAGKFTIKIDNAGKHFYEFDYTLPETH
jgi:hypothetical protein